MRLTPAEIQLILDALREKYGSGYSEVDLIGALQAKLSIMLEASAR